MSVPPEGVKVRSWLCDPMSNDVARSIHRIVEADDVRHVAVMPDVHLANDVCVGTVVATSQLIYPAAVGGDIGCGMAAVRFETDSQLLDDEEAAARVLAELYQHVPTNRHARATMPRTMPEELIAFPLSDRGLEKLKCREGRVQLGTLGRGDHFLEFQADSEEQLWLMVHSGSRAMGQAISKHHLDRTTDKSNGLKCFEAQSERGAAYRNDVCWALRYAAQNRLAMVKATVGLLREHFNIDTEWSTFLDAHHNHVQQEEHFGGQFRVHRKGAQSSRYDEPGIIPGSMGTASFHVAGRGCPESLCSSSHGAGRKLSRTQARQAISDRQLHRQVRTVWFDHRRAAALREEAPSAYRDIHAVMRAQKSLTRKTRELRPLLSYKGR
jgi:tRNA-splicing ligase RtcB